MKIYQLKTSQNLQISLEKAWDFFSNPKNLAKITPDWLSFNIKSDLPPKMHAGMIIIYTVRPVFNIPVTWVTEITHVSDKVYFVDEQRFGPYKLWHHEHFFKESENGGIVMDDKVSYAIPFGFVGTLFHKLFISKKISEIFSYRKTILEKMFNG